MINIFKKGHKTLTSDIDTWVVRWNRATGGIYLVDYEETAQFFSSKEEAEEFAESLKRALKLLDCNNGPLCYIRCEKVTYGGIDQ